jgi:hypothetical protein
MGTHRLEAKIDKVEELVERKISELTGTSYELIFCYIYHKAHINSWFIELHEHLSHTKVLRTAKLELDFFKKDAEKISDAIVLSLIFNHD